MCDGPYFSYLVTFDIDQDSTQRDEIRLALEAMGVDSRNILGSVWIVISADDVEALTTKVYGLMSGPQENARVFVCWFPTNQWDGVLDPKHLPWLEKWSRTLEA